MKDLRFVQVHINWAKYSLTEGLDKIRSHEQYVVERLMHGILHIAGVIAYAFKDGTNQAYVVSFNIEGYEPGEVGAILDQTFDIKARTGLHCAPAAHRTLNTVPFGMVIRLSPGYFNTVKEIDMALQALERIAKRTP